MARSPGAGSERQPFVSVAIGTDDLMETVTPIKEIVYSPDPAVWHPLTLLRRMAVESWRFRELVRSLVVRDLRAQYRRSLLGYLWAFIPSIATAVGFSLAKDAGVLRISETPVPYFVFVMVGSVLWQTFIDALNGPIEALSNFQTVMSRIYVPPEIIILAKVAEVMVNLLIKVLLLAVVFLFYGISMGPAALLIPILLVLLVMEGAAIGLILSPLAALYHDILKGLPIVIGFWFLLTPVVYPIPTVGLFSVIVRANPATYFLVAIRDLSIGGPMPDFLFLAIVGLISILGFAIALIAFRVSMPFVVERAGS
jgi:lipopolysaccharide transport system permease protein